MMFENDEKREERLSDPTVHTFWRGETVIAADSVDTDFFLITQVLAIDSAFVIIETRVQIISELVAE